VVADVYTRIYSDSDFASVSSALPYCFATRRHSQGHYFMYRPDKLPEDPACIVFLHGYGGNFMFYTWVLKEEFPDAIILVPSWSVSWAHGSSLYLRDMLKDAERRTGVSLERPWLMGISAGGYGGFSIYNRCSSHFRGYVCIASAPANAVAYALKPDLRILMLNGLDDAMAPIAVVRRQAGLVKKRGISFFRYRELDGNHFFLLSNRKATFDAIRAFMSDAAR
jgi:pimeloyl-ACP methyl ester carboxylesterase